MKALKVDGYYLDCKQGTGAQKIAKSGEKCKETG